MSTMDSSTTSPDMNDTNYSKGPPPIIVGIYGISGSGKSHLLDKLKENLDGQSFNFYEGSEELSQNFPDGLQGFKALDKLTQDEIRTKTIQAIREKCAKAGKTGIVTGHYMFWTPSAEQSSGAGNEEIVITDADKDVYTHILYLKTSPEIVVQQVKNDTTKQRAQLDANEIGKWQAAEQVQLRSICYKHSILFTTIQSNDLDQAVKLIRNAAQDNEVTNAARVDSLVDKMVPNPLFKNIETMLVLDADNTLAPYDASNLYWEAANYSDTADERTPLKALFQSELGYSYNAFRQATWLYEEDGVGRPGRFHDLCEAAASRIELFPEMRALLTIAVADDTIGVVIVTCGLSHVWAKVLQKMGLHDSITIFGGCQLSSGNVVSPITKQDSVSRLEF